MATSSDVASLPTDRREALLADLRALADTLPAELELTGHTRVDLFART
jgi:hypothetical protein